MYIDGIGITNYRSFGDELQLIGPFSKINLLIGRNNSGKSNVLKFLHEHYKNICDGVRQKYQWSWSVNHLDQHLTNIGDNNSRLAFGLNPEGRIIEQICQDHTLKPAVKALIKDNLLRMPELNPDGHLAWFIYEGPNLQMTLESMKCTLIKKHRNAGIRKTQNSPEFSLLDSQWAQIGKGLNVNRNRFSDFPSHLLGMFATLSPVNKPVPEIKMIHAVREIKPDEKLSEYRLNGVNIIQELQKLDRPDSRDPAYDTQTATFRKIVQFVRDVVEEPSLELQVAHNLETINVIVEGKSLPIENLGTGIHEVIILAVANTIVEDSVVCIEEPETHLHPILQKKLLKYLHENTSNQYFITTHSASMIDMPEASVFHVKHDGERSTVQYVTSPDRHLAIFSDLGYRPSDLLQANCIIWVEGPTDRTYIRHWLKSYDPDLEEGFHYSIMFYGGRLLSHLSVEHEIDDTLVEDFITLRKINPNLVVVIDSDKSEESDNLTDTKKRLRDEFNNGKGFAWITNGREIENYLPSDILGKAVKEVHSRSARELAYPNEKFKHHYHYYRKQDDEIETENINKAAIARKVIESEPELDVLDLQDRIHELANFIRTCNGLETLEHQAEAA